MNTNCPICHRLVPVRPNYLLAATAHVDHFSKPCDNVDYYRLTPREEQEQNLQEMIL